MKVDTDQSLGPWTDSLSIRIQLPLQPDTSDAELDTSDEDPGLKHNISRPRRVQMPKASIMTMRNLPVDTPLVLFTPVLIPAGSSQGISNYGQQGDPFEVFGQRLALHHPNICHVPYVSSVGFTDTHSAFVTRSNALITVICEPNHPMKQESLREQHDFAAAALKAFASRKGKATPKGEFVLVQCAEEKTFKRMQYGCASLIGNDVYDDETAVHLADAIFGYEDQRDVST